MLNEYQQRIKLEARLKYVSKFSFHLKCVYRERNGKEFREQRQTAEEKLGSRHGVLQ